MAQEREIQVGSELVKMEKRICDGGCAKSFWVAKHSTATRARAYCEKVCKEGRTFMGTIREPGFYEDRAERAKRREVLSLTPKYRETIETAIRLLEEAKEAGRRISLSTAMRDADPMFSYNDLGNAKYRLRQLADRGDEDAVALQKRLEAASSAQGGKGKGPRPSASELQAKAEEALGLGRQAQEKMQDDVAAASPRLDFERFIPEEKPRPANASSRSDLEPEEPARPMLAIHEATIPPCEGGCSDDDLIWSPATKLYRCRACKATQPKVEPAKIVMAVPRPQPIPEEIPESLEEKIQIYDTVQVIVEAEDRTPEEVCARAGIAPSVFYACRAAAEKHQAELKEKAREANRPDKTIAWEAAIEKGMEKGIAKVAEKLKADVVLPVAAQVPALAPPVAAVPPPPPAAPPADQVALEAILAALRDLPWRERARVLAAAGVFAGVPGAVFLVPQGDEAKRES